ncbi:PHP domain-containing protein [Holdemania massiliensis]|uniref:PHP domain-containing protein n=1 Tax=Holdemania massiliensis TaxID=1468449 RepID=UPI003D300B81
MNKKSQIDLHLQSCASDGVRTPKVIVNIAFANKINFITLTDHDTIRNVKEFGETAHEAGIAVLYSVEISVLFHSQLFTYLDME